MARRESGKGGRKLRKKRNERERKGMEGIKGGEERERTRMTMREENDGRRRMGELKKRKGKE